LAKKALVVEDDMNIAELLRLYLEKDGFTVYHAADGGEGVRMAQTIEPDLVLLDILLPVLDGWVVCGEIRKTPRCRSSCSPPKARPSTRSQAWKWARTTTS
jgi:DNA-binding response OmpR family regulator